MERTMRILVVSLALLIVAGAWLFTYPEPPVDPAWQLQAPAEVPEGVVTVRFSGTSTLLFDDGDTRWMVDGWFSRPGVLKLLGGKVAPDLQAIDYGLSMNQVQRLSALIPVHSHYDHAMDSPEVARRTGAVVIGSAATANISRGWGLPEAQIREVDDRETVALGDFRVTFYESQHFQFPDPQMVDRLLTNSEIPEPLVPPVSVYDYKLGKAYILHVEHPRGSALVVGSAGFIPGMLDELDVDVLFLGVGGLGSQTAQYREDYWRYVVEAVNPERIVPIHWDSLTGPLDGPMTGEIRIAGLVSGGEDNTLAFLKDKAAQNPAVPLQTLPRFAKMVLFP